MAKKMDPKLKREWVKALRSGEYKQGQDCLCQWRAGEFRFCCLGVLEDIATDADWVMCRDGYRYRVEDRAFGCSTSLVDMPEQEALALMNDEGSPFSEIADYIEKHL